MAFVTNIIFILVGMVLEYINYDKLCIKILTSVAHQNRLKFHQKLNGDNVIAPRDIFMDIVWYLEVMVVKYIN